jgi:hypothetical protein
LNFPEIDSTGELVCIRSGSNYALMVNSVAAGNALLIEPPPDVASWWDSAALKWVVKPPQPDQHHEWDRLQKAWRDPRTVEQIESQQMAVLRLQRNAALVKSDLLLLRALEQMAPPAVREYRQALRDLPAQPGALHLPLPLPVAPDLPAE